MSFEGFPSGSPVTPLPQALLRDLAPTMSDPAELVVTLYAIEELARVRRYPRRVLLRDLQECRALLESLAGLCPAREVEQAFADGLHAAVERGSLLIGRSAQAGVWAEWCALNDADGRRSLDSPAVVPASEASAGRVVGASGAPAIWQSAFGTAMPPILIEEVKAAESRYGSERLRDAFVEAAAHNARSWRYVQAILERWETEGRDAGDATARAAVGGLESSRYRHLFRE